MVKTYNKEHNKEKSNASFGYFWIFFEKLKDSTLIASFNKKMNYISEATRPLKKKNGLKGNEQ